MSTATAEPLLKIRDLTVSFSGFRAISNLDMDVEEGKIHVIIGPNGAGKSTLMDLITGKTKAPAATSGTRVRTSPAKRRGLLPLSTISGVSSRDPTCSTI